ncbi:hypothetical protein CAC42_4149 [Sphaceloma murrayae]|uniref:Uncharacterized protein n=1 Tax=Sphaceloma murrayae TaxID=2082308 RepID=A0A2K1QKM6_9PEZI|nr:hypothetical protein CAC42_4149 [Sphaceloma murrayae]
MPASQGPSQESQKKPLLVKSVSTSTSRSITQNPRTSKGDLQITMTSATAGVKNKIFFDSTAVPLYFLDDEALKRRQTHSQRR